MVPSLKMEFDTLEKAIDMYTTYAKRGGFDCKLGSTKRVNGVITYKYMYCNREGQTSKRTLDTLNGDNGVQNRKTVSKRTNCEALICFKQIEQSGRFLVSKFIDTHNHELYTNDTVHMSKDKRKLDYYDQSALYNLGINNIGATKTHTIMTGLKGGYENQGPTYVDYKNWSRDLSCFIGDSDANMLVNLMMERKKFLPQFSFEYICKDNHLLGCFWADGIAKRNYMEFSDVISFDATFRTNK